MLHLLYMEKYEKLYKNNKFKISAPAWNDKFLATDGLYSVSDIQDYFDNILKRMEKRMIVSQ